MVFAAGALLVPNASAFGAPSRAFAPFDATRRSSGRPTTRLAVANDYDKDDDVARPSLRRSLSATCAGAILAAFAVLPPPLPTDYYHDHSNAFAASAAAAVVESRDAYGNSGTTTTLPSPVLDEVDGLVRKYYADRTFRGRDWDTTAREYKAKVRTGDDAEQMDLAAEMVATLGDKYSRTLDKNAYARIQKYDLIGVGAVFMPEETKDDTPAAKRRIVVGAPPVAGSAADRAGLRAGDALLAVDGVPTAGRTAFDIIDQINSADPQPEEIVATMSTPARDDGTPEYTRDVTLQRTFSKVENPVDHRVSERRPDGYNVGYVRVKEFNSLVKPGLEKALTDLEQQGVNAYVLDLRGNPGGAFQSAVEVASLFLEPDTVATYVVDNNAVRLPFKTVANTNKNDNNDNKPPPPTPLVPASHPVAVWVDRRSASASEVLAGALHDNCRAVVLGERSYGKGLIQAVYGLRNGAGLVLTVARYVTPAGTDIQGTGIQPDYEGGVPKQPLGSFVTIVTGDTTGVDFARVVNTSRKLCAATTTTTTDQQ